MRNIGPISRKQLFSVGIKNIKDLKQLGAIEAFKCLEDGGYHPTRNMFYALVGAIENLDWREVADNMKDFDIDNDNVTPTLQ